MFSEGFSQRLRSRMSRLGVQANELAEKLEVTPGAVSNWMNGTNEAKGKNLRQLAEALRCDAHWLATGETDKPSVMGLQETPQSGYEAEVEIWKRRAKAAEKQLDTMRNMLRSILEISSPSATPPDVRISSKPPSDAQAAARQASSSATTDPSE